MPLAAFFIVIVVLFALTRLPYLLEPGPDRWVFLCWVLLVLVGMAIDALLHGGKL
jgi:hypothetical protein